MARIYLANNLGFYPLFKGVLVHIACSLSLAGHTVIEPFDDCAAKCDFAKPLEPQVAAINMDSIKSCDVVVALIDGSGPGVDDGIAWEMGYATGLGKRIIVLRTRNIEANPINLQLHGTGITITKSVQELLDSLA